MAEPSVVDRLKQRAKCRGLDLDRHIQKEAAEGGIIAHWNSTPHGFKFLCKNFDELNLALALLKSVFAPDSALGQRFQTGASWREVSQPDGLHVIVFKNRYVDELRTKICYANVHLDSISPVAGADPSTGRIRYEPGETIAHAMKDLKHSRVFVDTFKRGPQVGIRF
jgi:hypothetical protein